MSMNASTSFRLAINYVEGNKLAFNKNSSYRSGITTSDSTLEIKGIYSTIINNAGKDIIIWPLQDPWCNPFCFFRNPGNVGFFVNKAMKEEIKQLKGKRK